MVKAKFSSSGILSLVISLFLVVGLCFLVYALLSAAIGNGHIFNKVKIVPFDAIIVSLILCFFVFILLYVFQRFVFFITVNTDEQTITFRNVLTTKTYHYQFSDFDGFFDTFVVSKSGAYKNLYLISDNRAEKVISVFYFENIDEVQEALSPLKYFGLQKESGKISRRALLNKPLLDN